MTSDEAASLRKWDKIKYIGPIYKKNGDYRHAYTTVKRRVVHVARPPYMQAAAPELSNMLRLWIDISPLYLESMWFNPKDWELVERWAVSKDVAYARKYVPRAIKGLVKAVKAQQESYKGRIDEWLNKISLHEKMQILTGLTAEERRIFDFMYSDVEGMLKENETNQGE